MGPGQFDAPFRLPLPKGSVLVLKVTKTLKSFQRESSSFSRSANIVIPDNRLLVEYNSTSCPLKRVSYSHGPSHGPSQGNGADVAQHCIPSVASWRGRVSITFRAMQPHFHQ
eukprot:4222556-Pyramimonas_sp.AAC.1